MFWQGLCSGISLSCANLKRCKKRQGIKRSNKSVFDVLSRPFLFSPTTAYCNPNSRRGEVLQWQTQLLFEAPISVYTVV